MLKVAVNNYVEEKHISWHCHPFIPSSHFSLYSIHGLYRPSDRVRLKNANYAFFSGQIVRLERPIVQ